MNWPMLAGSLASVLTLAGIAWILGLGRTAAFGAADAMADAADAMPGDRPADTLMSADGRAAIVTGHGGAIAIVRAHGAHRATRALTRPLRWREDGDAVVVDAGGVGFGATRLILSKEDRDKLLTLM